MCFQFRIRRGIHLLLERFSHEKSFAEERSSDGDMFKNKEKSEHEAKLVICSHLKTNYPICFFINLER